MGSLVPTHLISPLLVVAMIAATYALIASVVARRNRRRSRAFFLLGYFCGFMSCAIVRRRRRGLEVLGVVARWARAGRLGVGLLSGTRRFATPSRAERARPHWELLFRTCEAIHCRLTATVPGRALLRMREE